MSFMDHIYLISNGSPNTFPDNSLTQFRNSLPNSFYFDKNDNVQVSIESIGFACNFRNLSVPDNLENPSVIVTDIGLYNSNCMKQLDVDRFRAKNCMDKYRFDYSQIGQDHVVFKEYFLDDRWHTDSNVREMCQKFNSDSLLRWDFTDKQLSISNNPHKDYWVLIHPSFSDSFNLQFASLVESEEWLEHYNPPVRGVEKNTFMYQMAEYDRIMNARIYENIFHQMVLYKGDYYYGYYLNKNAYKLVGKECENLHDAKMPEIIKVQSSIIASQILNNKHSKDLLCFCPDFKNIISNFYYTEFEQPQRIKLENTTLTSIDISLRDENDKKLQLLPGVPTIIKLKIDKMEKDNKTFNVRLTSNKNESFPNNTNSIFRVRLPNTLYLDREKNWKVAITSISHPNNFSTLAGDVMHRIIYFRGKDETKKYMFEDNRIYTKDDIVKCFNVLLDYHGESKFNAEGNFQILIRNAGTLIISNNILLILGYKGLLGAKKATKFVNEEDNDFYIKFEGLPDLKYLQPDYIISYCNIVEPSIIGGEYANILRIIPIPKERSDYIIQEFKNKNFLPLLNTEVSEIEINFRSHDGLPLNFSGSYNTIINLEFSNYN